MTTSTPSAPPLPVETALGAGPASPPGDAARREVVVGTDGSECALRAVRWATEEAARRGAPLRIVHAAPYLHARTRTAEGAPPEMSRARRITGQAYTVARHTDSGVHVTTEVVPDRPATALLRAASAGQLVVLGNSTTGAADELVFAPVARRVAARASQPVVVVPRRREPTPARPVVAVLGIGDPDDDEAVAGFAAEAARRADLRLSVLQTRSGRRSWAADESGWRTRYPGLPVDLRELPGVSGSHLLAEACPAYLIALSAGHGSLLHRDLDGAHRWLLRHCTSPLALVPPVHRPDQEPREEIIAVG